MDVPCMPMMMKHSVRHLKLNEHRSVIPSLPNPRRMSIQIVIADLKCTRLAFL